MSPLIISILIALCAVGGAMLGFWLRRVLPDHHVDDSSKDVVRVSIGLVVTMTSLLLSLAISSAKTTFGAADASVKQTATEISHLHQYLQLYGPETAGIQTALQQLVAQRAIHWWPQLTSEVQKQATPGAGTTTLVAQILMLKPETDDQRWLKAQALSLADEQQQSSFFSGGLEGDMGKAPFILLLCFWLVMIFVSFGLFAPAHMTGKVTLLFSAFSVAIAIFLILELEHPFRGLITVSPDPIMHVIEQLAHNR